MPEFFRPCRVNIAGSSVSAANRRGQLGACGLVRFTTREVYNPSAELAMSWRRRCLLCLSLEEHVPVSAQAKKICDDHRCRGVTNYLPT